MLSFLKRYSLTQSPDCPIYYIMPRKHNKLWHNKRPICTNIPPFCATPCEKLRPIAVCRINSLRNWYNKVNKSQKFLATALHTFRLPQISRKTYLKLTKKAKNAKWVKAFWRPNVYIFTFNRLSFVQQLQGYT